MAKKERSSPQQAEPVTPVKPAPFPGESPTVSLAMAAARMYGVSEKDEKPASSRPKRKAASRKKVVAPKKKPAARSRKPTK